MPTTSKWTSWVKPVAQSILVVCIIVAYSIPASVYSTLGPCTDRCLMCSRTDCFQNLTSVSYAIDMVGGGGLLAALFFLIFKLKRQALITTVLAILAVIPSALTAGTWRMHLR